MNRSLPTCSTSPTVHVFGSLLQTTRSLSNSQFRCNLYFACRVKLHFAVAVRIKRLKTGTGMTFSHPSMLLSVSKAAICLKVSEGRQYCFSSSIRSFRASLSMWANTSLSKNGRRGPSISMEAPMRPCSEMPYQWRQKDFKQYVLCKSAQSDYLAYLTCIAIQV